MALALFEAHRSEEFFLQLISQKSRSNHAVGRAACGPDRGVRSAATRTSRSRCTTKRSAGDRVSMSTGDVGLRTGPRQLKGPLARPAVTIRPRNPRPKMLGHRSTKPQEDAILQRDLSRNLCLGGGRRGNLKPSKHGEDNRRITTRMGAVHQLARNQVLDDSEDSTFNVMASSADSMNSDIGSDMDS